MRVGILGLQHESNTFSPKPTTLTDFQNKVLLTGDAVRQEMADTHHELAGFFAGMDQAGHETVPLLFTQATPAGAIDADTADQLIRMAMEQLDNAGPLDGLLVAPHGAGVSEKYRDFDGHWLSLVRERVGPDAPMICTLDPHANVSQRMIDACDATVAYHTNPHIDQRDVGLEAAHLMDQTLRGRIKPTQAMGNPRTAISIDKQETAAQPCVDLYDQARNVLQQDGVLSTSVILGFPYADVAEMGSKLIVVTDNNTQAAQDHSDELAHWLREHRHRYDCDLPTVEQAVKAAAADKKRVCLLDVGDNIGGGSAADGTEVAHALHRQSVGRSFVCLYDPPAAEKASTAGVGARLDLSMGGASGEQRTGPLTAQVSVRKLHDGKFQESQPRHGGRVRYDMGATAIVETDTGLTVMLNSIRTPPFSLQQLIGAGLDPERFHVLVAKGVNAPIAAYETVCQRFIRVNTTGVTGADMTTFTFHHRPKPLHPFED